jgi:hypothetical protein
MYNSSKALASKQGGGPEDQWNNVGEDPRCFASEFRRACMRLSVGATVEVLSEIKLARRALDKLALLTTRRFTASNNRGSSIIKRIS